MATGFTYVHEGLVLRAPEPDPYEGMRFEGVEAPGRHEEWCDERHNLRVIDCLSAAEIAGIDEQMLRYAR